MVADGEDLGARFEGTQMMRFKLERDGGETKVVGGEMGGDDSGIVVSESGVTKTYGDEIVGYAFDAETRAALAASFTPAFTPLPSLSGGVNSIPTFGGGMSAPYT